MPIRIVGIVELWRFGGIGGRWIGGSDSARTPDEQPVPRYWAGLRNGFAVVGLFAVAYLALNGVYGLDAGVVTRSEAAFPPKRVSLATDSHELAPVAVRSTHDPRQQPLVRHIAKNYRIAEEAAQKLVAAAFDAGKGYSLDPILILAVMAIESRFNPIAESDMGAKGLMQVMSKVHFDKLDSHGGEDMVLDPWTNIVVGAQILRESIDRAGGVEAGLQWYNGAANDPSRQYAEKVLGEYDRLAQLVGRPRAPRSAPIATPAVPAALTKGAEVGPAPAGPPAANAKPASGPQEITQETGVAAI